MAQYYDRYEDFRFNNQVKTQPFIKIINQSTDITIEYKSNKTRLDIVSNTYYGTPYYGWLILQANPQYGGLEFDIPDRASIRVPYPLITAIQAYQQSVDAYNVLYKINS